MASIITKDGIVVEKLSDDEANDSQRLRDEVARIRAEREAAATAETQASDDATDDAQETPDFLQRAFDYAQREVPRQLGLTGRYIAEGVATPVTMLGDAANALLNLGASGAERATGVDLGRFLLPSQVLSQGLTGAGLPQPEGLYENIAAVPARVLAGTGGMVKGAQMAGEGLTATPKMIANALAMRPGTQAVAGNIAAPVAMGADAAVTSITGSPVAGDVAGMIAGVATPAPSTTMAGSIASGTRSALQPFGAGGREQVVANLLRSNTANPGQAIRNLEQAQPLAPNAPQTTAGASRDPGLASMEAPVFALDNSAASPVRTQRQTAQTREMENLAKSDADLERLIAAREAKTTTLREESFNNAAPVQIKTVLDDIDAQLAAPQGARKTVRDALARFRSEIEAASVDGAIDARRLYEIRKDLNLAMRGQLKGDDSNFRLARGELADVKNSIDSNIEAVAPGYQNYLRRYSRLSKPIDQLRALQEIQRRTTMGQPDAAQGDVVNANQLRRIIRNNTVKIEGRDIKLSDTLSAVQKRRLNRLLDDLEQARAGTAPGIRPAGSDTVSKLSTMNLIGRMFGSGFDNPAVRTAARPLDFLYKFPDKAMQDLLVASMLDAKLAAMLLRRASPENSKNFAERTREMFPELFVSPGVQVGATVGTQNNQNAR